MNKFTVMNDDRSLTAAMSVALVLLGLLSIVLSAALMLRDSPTTAPATSVGFVVTHDRIELTEGVAKCRAMGMIPVVRESASCMVLACTPSIGDEMGWFARVNEAACQ